MKPHAVVIDLWSTPAGMGVQEWRCSVALFDQDTGLLRQSVEHLSGGVEAGDECLRRAVQKFREVRRG